MTEAAKLKKFPVLKTDEEAENFLETADLTEYDWSDMKRVQFEFKNKDARVNMRLPASLLAEVKAAAAKAGMPYQRFIRQALEGALGR
jgi:predicted DNA binding CopG/RHH family protein